MKVVKIRKVLIKLKNNVNEIDVGNENKLLHNKCTSMFLTRKTRIINLV